MYVKCSGKNKIKLCMYDYLPFVYEMKTHDIQQQQE